MELRRPGVPPSAQASPGRSAGRASTSAEQHQRRAAGTWRSCAARAVGGEPGNDRLSPARPGLAQAGPRSTRRHRLPGAVRRRPEEIRRSTCWPITSRPATRRPDNTAGVGAENDRRQNAGRPGVQAPERLDVNWARFLSCRCGNWLHFAGDRRDRLGRNRLSGRSGRDPAGGASRRRGPCGRPPLPSPGNQDCKSGPPEVGPANSADGQGETPRRARSGGRTAVCMTQPPSRESAEAG